MNTSQATTADQRRTYTVGELAAVTGLSVQATYYALRRGDLPGVRIGKQWVIPRAEVDKLVPPVHAPRSVQ